MRTERVTMLVGELYDPLNAELAVGRERGRDFRQALNATREPGQEQRRPIVSDLFWAGGDTVLVQVCLGGGAIILPGVRIGSRAVIGAGRAVTRDVPEGAFAAGNPCRVIRPITEEAG